MSLGLTLETSLSGSLRSHICKIHFTKVLEQKNKSLSSPSVDLREMTDVHPSLPLLAPHSG